MLLFRFELFTDDLLCERVSKGGLEKDKYKHEVAKGLSFFRGVKKTLQFLEPTEALRETFMESVTAFFTAYFLSH